MEIWKDVKGYEGLYQVSNLGNVKSNYSKKIIKPSCNGFGYLKVVLCKNKTKKTIYVHKLVINAFCGIMNEMQVNHIDRNKLNNCLDNLEYVTARENISYIRAYKFVGVRKRKDNGKYRAVLHYKNQTINIGQFDNEQDAFNAYLKKLKELNLTNKYANKF